MLLASFRPTLIQVFRRGQPNPNIRDGHDGRGRLMRARTKPFRNVISPRRAQGQRLPREMRHGIFRYTRSRELVERPVTLRSHTGGVFYKLNEDHGDGVTQNPSGPSCWSEQGYREIRLRSPQSSLAPNEKNSSQWQSTVTCLRRLLLENLVNFRSAETSYEDSRHLLSITSGVRVLTRRTPGNLAQLAKVPKSAREGRCGRGSAIKRLPTFLRH
jgi:hypothetical protein